MQQPERDYWVINLDMQKLKWINSYKLKIVWD